MDSIHKVTVYNTGALSMPTILLTATVPENTSDLPPEIRSRPNVRLGRNGSVPFSVPAAMLVS